MALELLLGSDFGLMSLAGIVFMIFFCIFLARMYVRKMNEDAAKYDK
jgi:hypothetical protein